MISLFLGALKKEEEGDALPTDAIIASLALTHHPDLLVIDHHFSPGDQRLHVPVSVSTFHPTPPRKIYPPGRYLSPLSLSLSLSLRKNEPRETMLAKRGRNPRSLTRREGGRRGWACFPPPFGQKNRGKRFDSPW